MLNKSSMLLAAAVVALGAGAAFADPYDYNDSSGDRYDSNSHSYSDQSQTGYGNGYNYGYDDGYARRDRNDRYRTDTYRVQVRDGRYERGAYYYGSDCGDNAAAGTVLGAVIGGVVGNQFGRGDGRTAATVGGVIVGGIAGNAIASDMDCNDRHYAMSSYHDGFEGRIGQRYNWRNDHSRNYGSFTPTREYSRDGYTCRDFQDVTYRDGHEYDRSGTACRENDGNWHME